jgi:hypothetical protein
MTAMALVFVLSWFSAVSILFPDKRAHVGIYIFFGAVAALTHVYAALFCGALAVGLIVASFLNKERALAISGLALGASASITTLAWLLKLSQVTRGNWTSQIEWIQFNFDTVMLAAQKLVELSFGGPLGAGLFALILFSGLVFSGTRTLAIVFLVTYTLFIFVPIIASFKQPMINGRYWPVGASSVIPLLALLARSIWLNRGGKPFISAAVLSSIFAFFSVSTINGAIGANRQTVQKPVWQGAAVVKPLIGECADKSVRVAGFLERDEAGIHSRWAFVPGLAMMAGTRTQIFVSIAENQTPILKVSDVRCPVLGWAEDTAFDPRPLSDDELLRALKIEAAPGTVDIRRHKSGFVVLKRDESVPAQ